MVLYTSADLLWASRIKATADALGTPCRPVRSLETLDARLHEGGVRAILLDLDAHELAFAILNRLNAPHAHDADRAIHTIAWGPHVEVDLLAEARALGCHRVLTRGQFSNELDKILRDHAQPPA